ncbi:MAG: hypothetical protein AAF570_20500 [Bacteroidota bacterium]
MEWIGVNGLLESIPSEVIHEATHPDARNVRDPWNFEPLKRLVSIGLSASVREDLLAADFGADISYEGEFGFDHLDSDTLTIPVVVDEQDTVIQVIEGHIVTKLEFAALKLFAMQRKMEYELNQHFGSEFRFLHEGEQFDFDEEDEWLPIIRLRKIRLITDNPNQKPFLLNKVEMKFLRHRAGGKQPEEQGETRGKRKQK